jgi:replicative DNA helicase
VSWLDDHYRPAKEAADLRYLLGAHGVPLSGDKTLATWRGEKTPSVHIYPDHWHDYGSGERGDLLDWLELAEGLSKEEAQHEAARLLGLPAPGSNGQAATAPRPPPRAPQKPREAPQDKNWINELATQAHAALRAAQTATAKRARQYLQERGLTSMVELLRLGVVDESVTVRQAGSAIDAIRGRLLIPTLQDGVATFYNARALGERATAKYLKPSGTTPAPFNADALEEAGPLGFLVLTEGEFDAASVLIAKGTGYPVIGCSGGVLPQGWAERIKRSGVKTYLLFDNDDSGRAKAEKLHALLSGLGVRAFVAHYPDGYKDANKMLQAAGAEALSQAIDHALADAEAATVSDLLYIRDSWLSELDARANRPHSAYTTGLEPLDALLNGGYLEGLHLLGGITGAGKTAFALHLAVHNALEGRNVIYGSYEQSRLELWARIATAVTGVPYDAIKRGIYNQPDGERLPVSKELRASAGWEKLEQIARHLKVVEGGDAFSRSEGSYTVEVLAKNADAIAEERGAPPLVIVDYLQRVPIPASEKATVRERLDYVAGQLQVNLAREVGCPVIAISSLNRLNYTGLAKEPIESRLTAFKESGGLEYTAYTAALLYKLPEEKQGAGFTPGAMRSFAPMVLDVVKNREGNTGRFAVKWGQRSNAWHGTCPYGRDHDTL